MLKYFIELGKEGNISSKEVTSKDAPNIRSNIWQADFWALYEQEVTDADGVLYVSAKRNYIEKRHFKSSFKLVTVQEFVSKFSRQTSIIRALREEGCVSVWMRYDVNKLIVYAALDGDVADPE